MKNKRIASFALAGTIALSGLTIFLAKTKLNKETPYIDTTIQYIDTTTTNVSDENIVIEEETTNQPTLIDQTTTNIVSETNNINTYMEKYKNIINEICIEKNYDENTRKIIYKTVEMLYENYDNLYQVYKDNGIPKKETFIENIFLVCLREKIDKITISTDNVNNNISLLSPGTGKFYPRDKEICIKSDSNNINLYLCEKFVHEVIHSTQVDMLTNPLKSLKGEWIMISEGESILFQTSIKKELSCDDFSQNFKTDDPSVIYYIIGTGDGSYNTVSKFYNTLLILTDYNTMSQYKEDLDLNNIKSVINQKYNTDCNDIVDKMCKIIQDTHYVDYSSSGKYLKEIDEFVLSCLETKIDNSNTKEEVESIFNLYRYFKLQYCTRVVKNESEFEMNDITESVIDFSKCEEKLFNKIEQNKVYPNIFINEEKNKDIFYSVVGMNSNNSSIEVINEQIVLNNCYGQLSSDNNIYNIVEGNKILLQYYLNEKRVVRYESEMISFDNQKIII